MDASRRRSITLPPDQASLATWTTLSWFWKTEGSLRCTQILPTCFQLAQMIVLDTTVHELNMFEESIIHAHKVTHTFTFGVGRSSSCTSRHDFEDLCKIGYHFLQLTSTDAIRPWRDSFATWTEAPIVSTLCSRAMQSGSDSSPTLYSEEVSPKTCVQSDSTSSGK